MRYRQVHLDLHSSERIEGIGSRFDPDAFARTAAGAHVDSMTIFSKCHHGWSYHPTGVGKAHPHLGFDLMRVLHLLHATPVLRGLIRNDNVQPIQHLVTLAEIEASIATEHPARSVRLVPGGELLPFTSGDGRVKFVVPKLRGHAMVEITF